MRARMDAWFVSFVDESSKVKPRPDWGLNGPEPFVQEAFLQWYESGFVVLPFAGGWFDQPEWLRRDLELCKWGVAYHRQRIKGGTTAPAANAAQKNGFFEVFGRGGE